MRVKKSISKNTINYSIINLSKKNRPNPIVEMELFMGVT